MFSLQPTKICIPANKIKTSHRIDEGLSPRDLPRGKLQSRFLVDVGRSANGSMLLPAGPSVEGSPASVSNSTLEVAYFG